LFFFFVWKELCCRHGDGDGLKKFFAEEFRCGNVVLFLVVEEFLKMFTIL
jgi:hypothetical protein